NKLAPIATSAEVSEVESAVHASQQSGLAGVHTHLTTAVSLLGQRPTPEIRKAVEEAILALEAVAKLVTGVDRGGLDAALEELSRRLKLRPALKAAIANLYGDASGKLGVRHAMLQEAGVDVAEARFFVITCSAFVNPRAPNLAPQRERLPELDAAPMFAPKPHDRFRGSLLRRRPAAVCCPA